MMSRKDYVRIAHVVATAACDRDTATAVAIAHGVATVMAQDNPRFDRDRFLKACGVTS